MGIRGAASSGGGHTIEDEGTPLTQRDDLNFEGAGVAVADSGGKTVVTVGGGAGISTTSNVGLGEGLAKALVGSDAPFKSLIGDSEISLIGNTNDVTFSIGAAIARLATIQKWTAKQQYLTNLFAIRNPADTFEYLFASSAIVADRTITLPLMTGNDSLVLLAFAQVLLNKTLTSPVINTQLTGTAILDEDDMVSDSALKVATQQSIKAYVDAQAFWLTSFGGGDTPVGDNTEYHGSSAISGSTNVHARSAPVSVGCTASNFSVVITANGRTTSTVFSFNIDGINGNQTFTVVTLDTGLFEDASNTDTLSAGERISCESAQATGANNITIGGYSVKFVA